MNRGHLTRKGWLRDIQIWRLILARVSQHCSSYPRSRVSKSLRITVRTAFIVSLDMCSILKKDLSFFDPPFNFRGSLTGVVFDSAILPEIQFQSLARVKLPFSNPASRPRQNHSPPTSSFESAPQHHAEQLIRNQR
jgi:hypothetical protein